MGLSRTTSWQHLRQYAINATRLIEAMAMARHPVMTVTGSRHMCWDSRGWIKKVPISMATVRLSALRVMI
jgi:hypothetical protein